jgi:hypothetical protein|tara:strand:+ start:6344 stop:6709 length:366 start_codon:yes stop_codon:yes gene_type:complete
MPKTTKAATTKTAATKTTKAKVKATKKPAAPKVELRKPQTRIMLALNAAKAPMSRTAISEAAPVDVATLVEYIGSHDDARRLKNDKKFPSLLTLGLVKAVVQEDVRGVCYESTAKGRKITG